MPQLLHPLANRAPALLAAGISFCTFLAWAYPYPDWLDSPELAVSALNLGMFHPPGSPLAVTVGYILTNLPAVITGSYRLIVMSPLFAAIATYLVARMLGTILTAPLTGAILATSAFALAPGVLLEATRLEVYTLAIALGLIVTRDAFTVLDADASFPDLSARSSYVLGASLCVHPLIGLACAAAWFAPLTTRWRSISAKLVAKNAVYAVLGAFWLLALPLFVHGPRDHRWGELTTVGEWLDFVRGKAFAQSFGTSGDETSSLANTTLMFLQGTGGGVLAACAASGLVGLLSKRRYARFAAYAAVLIVDFATLATQKTVLLSNPDAVAYLLPAFAVAVLLAGEACALFAKGHRATVGLGALVASFAFAQSFGEIRSSDRSQCNAGPTLGAMILEALPPRASIMLDDFNLVFMLEYLTSVEGLRKDISVRYRRDPEVGSTASPRILDASPQRIERAKSNVEALMRRGLLWEERSISSAGTMSNGGVVDEALFSWQPVCTSGAPVDERAAAAIEWQGFMSSQLALVQGDRVSARAFARLAHCAAPLDEMAAKHATALGAAACEQAASSPGQRAEAAQTSLTLGQGPDFTLRTMFMAFALILWCAGFVERGRWRMLIAATGAMGATAVLWIGR